MTGRVRTRRESWGFIRGQDGEGYFFHDSDQVGGDDVEEGDTVTFEVVSPQPERGPRAKNVMRKFS